MEYKISVIVPVYNAEEYLRDCINSLISQTYKNLELIFIDDGSIDASGQILDQEKALDDRIRVIHQKNIGSSRSRQKGIDISTGDYITFVDADDKININAYDVIMSKIEKDVDILQFGISIDFVSENYSIKRFFESSSLDKEELIERSIESEVFSFVWNKLYKKELLENEIFFPEKFNQGEDFVFNCRAFSKAKKIQNINDILYLYIKRKSESMVSRFTPNNNYIICEKEEKLEMLLKNNKQVISNYLLKEYEAFVLNLFKKNCDLTFMEKVKNIKEVIYSNKAQIYMQTAKPSYLYGKIFKFIWKFKSSIIMGITYKILTFVKDLLGSIYLFVRKFIYVRE